MSEIKEIKEKAVIASLIGRIVLTNLKVFQLKYIAKYHREPTARQLKMFIKKHHPKYAEIKGCDLC